MFSKTTVHGFAVMATASNHVKMEAFSTKGFLGGTYAANVYELEQTRQIESVFSCVDCGIRAETTTATGQDETTTFTGQDETTTFTRQDETTISTESESGSDGPSQETDRRLSNGALAGIAMAVAVVIVVIVLIFYVSKKRKRAAKSRP